ncbi:MAG: hypothetical protein RLZZ177_1023, partial [Pseudomonadota bacterium]
MGVWAWLVWAAFSINVAQAQATDTTGPVDQTPAAADPQPPEATPKDVT